MKLGTALVLNNLRVKLNQKNIINFNNKVIKINWGDKVALLGKNGAGKSTLINAIIGKVAYQGKIIKDFNNSDIGIVFQKNEYSDLMKVKELIKLVFKDQKSNVPDFNKFCAEYNLVDLLNKYIKDLSIGEKQRLTIGLVLSQQKNIYFLDELTSGLDYEKRELLEQNIKVKTKEATVIQITHYFEEIENWANKLIIIDHGKLLFQGSICQFLEKYPHYSCIEILPNKLEINYRSLLKEYSDVCFYNNRIFPKDRKQHCNIMTLFSNKEVSYKIKKKSIYTAYLLMMGEYNDFEYSSKHKNAI